MSVAVEAPAESLAGGPEEQVSAAPAAGTLLLSLGTVASGVLAYAFNAVAARTLGPADYGPIAVLWATTFLVAVVLFRPVEQTLSRGIAKRLAEGTDARTVARSVSRLCAASTVAAVVACLVAWQPLTDRLFDGHAFVTAMLIAGIVGYGLSYFVRGIVGGGRWYAGYGMVLLGDGVVRLAVVLPLFAVASVDLAAAAIAGAAFAGAVAPLLDRRGWRKARDLGGAPGPRFEVKEATRFAAPVAVLAAADQILLSGGPVLVMLGGGAGSSAAAAVVFAATMLIRAPAYLFQGVAAALLPNLTTLSVREDEHRFRQAVRRIVLILSAFSAAMVLGALVAGPAAMHLLYGPDFIATRTELALLALGGGGYLVAATLTQAALARAETFWVAGIWVVSAALFVLLELTLAGGPLYRVSLAFAAAALLAAAACIGLALLGRQRAPRAARARLVARGLATVGATDRDGSI